MSKCSAIPWLMANEQMFSYIIVNAGIQAGPYFLTAALIFLIKASKS